jgi:hypothetical protein
MIYLNQLIFVREGKEAIFHQFEDFVMPLIAQHNGRIVYRLRPDADNFIAGSEQPYEIHFISFDTEEDFEHYMKDDRRLKYVHLKNESVRSSWIVKGVKL